MCIRDRDDPVLGPLVDGIAGTGRQAARVRAVVADPLEVDCLLYTSDAADERSSVDLGGRRIIKKKTEDHNVE